MTEVAANPTRIRGGGRTGRAALRAADAHRQGPAFIRRQIPAYKLLGERARSVRLGPRPFPVCRGSE